MPLLAKGAIEIIPSAQRESGFYSCYFLFPKNHSSLRPILDQRLLNRALMRRPFRMITLKQILPQISLEDWFFSLDVKDAYFHIQIAPRNWPFLRFTFEGVAYQYTVLPFGLSLAPRTFMKWMDAALSPLRQMGIHILHYLDDWLVLAQSEVELLSHRSLLLSQLECLGLRVNFANFCQWISFLGTVFNSGPGPFGQHDCGGLHKSPRRSLLEAPLLSSETPLGMVAGQTVFAKSNTCAGQIEPEHRHAVTEQRPLRGVNSPSASG